MACDKEVAWGRYKTVGTIVEIGTVGLDSGIVGRANGNSVEML